MDGFDSELVYPSLTKEEKETLLAKKIEDIRRKNKELERRHAEIEADKRLAVGSRASVQLPPATAAVRRAPADDVGDEGEAAASASTVGVVDARRVERMPSQSGDGRRELQGTSPTAVAHGRSGRTPARRGRGPSDKGKISGRGGGARCSSRDSSLLKFPLKKPGLGFRRFSRESLTAGRRRAWPPKKGTGRAPEPNSWASGAEPAAACDRPADGGRLAAKPGGPTGWRAQHRRGGSGDVTTVVAAATAVAAAHKGGIADGVDSANGAVAPVARNSPSGRSGSGSGLSEAAGGAADGIVTGSRESGTKSGACSDRARGSAGRSLRKNYEETRKRNSAAYEDEQPLQQQQQQQRQRSGTGTADGAANCSPPPAQPTRLDLEMRLTGRERRAYSAWKEERDRVDEERLGRARDAGGGWRREWDADKAEPPTPPPSLASTGSAPITTAAAAPQWPAPASAATALSAAPVRSVLSAAAPAWPYAQLAQQDATLPLQPLQQHRQQRQRQQNEMLPPTETSAGWLDASKNPALPPPSGCQRRAVGSGRFMSQGDRRKSGPGSGSSDSTCPATAEPREDTSDLRARRQPAWSDSERKPPARRAPPPPRSPAGSRGGRGGRGGSVGGNRGRRWPSRGGWRMQRSAYGGSASSLHRPSSRASVVEDIVIIHVEDDDGETSSSVDAVTLGGGRPAVKTDGAEAAAAAAAAVALSVSGEMRIEARAPASSAAGLASCGAAAAIATSSAAADARSGRAGGNRKHYPDEQCSSSSSNSGRRRRGGGGRGRSQTAAAATGASRDDARATALSRPRVDGHAGPNKDDEWEDVADGDSGTR